MNSGCLNSQTYSRPSVSHALCLAEGEGREIMCHTPWPYCAAPLSSVWRTLWKSYLFSCRTKLAKLLCLKCFGKIVLVNFSFCSPRLCRVRSLARPRRQIRQCSYLQYDKAVAVIAPAYYFIIRGVFQHSGFQRQVSKGVGGPCLGASGRLMVHHWQPKTSPAYLYSLRTWLGEHCQHGRTNQQRRRRRRRRRRRSCLVKMHSQRSPTWQERDGQRGYWG